MFGKLGIVIWRFNQWIVLIINYADGITKGCSIRAVRNDVTNPWGSRTIYNHRNCGFCGFRTMEKRAKAPIPLKYPKFCSQKYTFKKSWIGWKLEKENLLKIAFCKTRNRFSVENYLHISMSRQISPTHSPYTYNYS